VALDVLMLLALAVSILLALSVPTNADAGNINDPSTTPSFPSGVIGNPS